MLSSAATWLMLMQTWPAFSQVRVLPHDAPVPGLAAEFQPDRRQILRGLRHDVLRDARGARVENLVEALRKQKVRGIVAAPDDRDVFRREGIRDERRDRLRRSRRLCADLQHCGIPARDRCGQNAEGKQDRKVEGADDEAGPVRHLVDLRQKARKAGETAEMRLRPCPFPQAFRRLRDLCKQRSDVGQIRLLRRAGKVFSECKSKRRLMRDDRLAKLLQHFQPERDVKRLSSGKVFLLRRDQAAERFLRIFHKARPPLSSYHIRRKKSPALRGLPGRIPQRSGSLHPRHAKRGPGLPKASFLFAARVPRRPILHLSY